MAVDTVAGAQTPSDAKNELPAAAAVQVRLRVPDDQQPFVPMGAVLSTNLRPECCPRIGETVALSPTSAWVVVFVVHEWPTAARHHVDIWLERVPEMTRIERPPGNSSVLH